MQAAINFINKKHRSCRFGGFSVSRLLFYSKPKLLS
ncbi:hypothetical protein G159_14305 [Planococcus glaciei CHR43]|nr:hypothetical protein G159_14305 [Planococcus glaciei CHR43]